MTRLLSIVALVASIGAIGFASTPQITPTRDLRWSLFTTLEPRSFANAVALPTGEILVVGGLDPRDQQVTNPKAELIDPLAHAATVLPQTILPRLHQTMTLSQSDRVVVAGGVVWQGANWSPVDQVDVYDIAHRQWRSGAPLLHARSDGAAVAFPDGRVAVFGGNFNTTLLDSVEIYDARRDVWTQAAPMPRPRTQHTAVLLNDGHVLITGGIDSDGGATDSTFLYDPRTDSWQAGPRMMHPRFQQATVRLANGDVLFIGGDGDASGTSELYLAREQRFTPSGALSMPRLVAQAAALPDGRVVVAGGLPLHMSTYRPLDSVEVWDPATGIWTPAHALAAGRAWGALVRVDRSLYLVSGNGEDETPFETVETVTVD